MVKRTINKVNKKETVHVNADRVKCLSAVRSMNGRFQLSQKDAANSVGVSVGMLQR